jgi:hypothetical protein
MIVPPTASTIRPPTITSKTVDSIQVRMRRPYRAARADSTVNRAARATPSDAKNPRGRAPKAPKASRGRDDGERPDAHPGVIAHATLHPFQPPGLEQPSEAVFAGLSADPERDEGAEERTGGRQQRVEPEQLRLSRGEDDDREVDPERQEEDQRRVQRAHDDQAAGCEEVAEKRVEDRAHPRSRTAWIRPSRPPGRRMAE